MAGRGQVQTGSVTGSPDTWADPRAADPILGPSIVPLVSLAE